MNEQQQHADADADTDTADFHVVVVWAVGVLVYPTMIVIRNDSSSSATLEMVIIRGKGGCFHIHTNTILERNYEQRSR